MVDQDEKAKQSDEDPIEDARPARGPEDDEHRLAAEEVSLVADEAEGGEAVEREEPEEHQTEALSSALEPDAVQDGPARVGPSLQSTYHLPFDPSPALCAQIEALLFVSQSPLSARTLGRLLSLETGQVRQAIELLRQACADRGVEPQEVAGGYQMRTKPRYAELIRQLLQSKPARLSRAALETIAIIAYRQPITRAEIEDIRGVDCGAVLKSMLDRRLLRILGRKEEPGRPILYGTTPAFLELFSLKSLKELPTLREFVELSEEHQRLVDRDAPTPEDATRRELEGYLADLGDQGEEELERELEELVGLDDEGPDPPEPGLEEFADLDLPEDDTPQE